MYVHVLVDTVQNQVEYFCSFVQFHVQTLYIAVLSQSISGVSAINPLVAFYDVHEKKGGIL
jgi:hypothetical protein